MRRQHESYRFTKLGVAMLSVMLLLLSLALPVQGAGGNGDTTPSGSPLSSLGTITDTYVAARQRTTAAVSVVVIKDGQTVFDKAYGFADIERQVAADTDTVFEWGSTTKLLVWTSVMQLAEQGKLDLETDIREYLPQGFLKKLKYEKPVTLLNLMNHNAGWQDRITDLYYFAEEDIPELGEALQTFEPRQVYQPGTVVAYSNFGAALAAYIVELQSGEPFYTYVKQHIFEVVGMDNTSIHPAQQDNPAIAQRMDNIQGYTTSLKLIKKNRGYMGIYPAGSAMGTAEDAAKFLAALMPAAGSSSPLFQSQAALKEMLSPSLNYEGTAIPRIAHGFFEINHTLPALEHGGNTAAFSSKFTLDPASGFGMVVLTNQANEWEYTTGLTDKVFGEYKPEAYSGDMPESSEVEGQYLSARRGVHGFTKILGYLNGEKITAINNRTYSANGLPFKQIAPYMYAPVHQSGLEYFIHDHGTVTKKSTVYNDAFPVSGLTAYSVTISLTLLGIAALFTIVALISGLAGFIFRRIKRQTKAASEFYKYHLWVNTAGLLLIVNNAILGYRLINYTTYSSIRIHFIVNLLYVLLAGSYIVLLLMWLRRTQSGEKGKIMYVLSGASALIFSAIIAGWDLFY